MITLCTFCTQDMTISANKLADSAAAQGVDKTIIYSPESLGEDFKIMAGDTLRAERGAGYWIWKPYIILRALSELSDGQILIYSDAGILFNIPIHYPLDSMDQDILLFSNTHKHYKWIKKEALKYFRISVDHSQEQVQASVIFFKASDFTRRFLQEWLAYCLIPGIIDDHLDPRIQVSAFIEHRHDQALLTELAYRHGIRLHYWATQYSRFCPPQFKDNYPAPMFIHHRKRNNEY